MKITIENPTYKQKVIIEKEELDDANINNIWEELIKPCLLAMGYQQNSIDEYFIGEKDDNV